MRTGILCHTRRALVYNSSQTRAVKANLHLELHGEIKMKKLLIVSAVTALAIVAALVTTVQAQKGKQVIYVSSAHATYKTSPMAGVSMQTLWGDMDKGPHATFSKFDPGFDAGMHTHTNDVSIVV